MCCFAKFLLKMPRCCGTVSEMPVPIVAQVANKTKITFCHVVVLQLLITTTASIIFGHVALLLLLLLLLLAFSDMNYYHCYN